MTEPLAPLVSGEAADRISYLDTAIERMNDLIGRALRRAIRAGTKGLGDTVTAATDAPPPGDPSPFISLDDLAAINAAWQEAMRDEILPAIGRSWEKGAGWTAEELALIGPRADLSMPAAESFLLNAQSELDGVGLAVWQDVRQTLVQGMSAGESIEQLAARVREVAGTATVDARRLARTQVIGSTNAGALAQVQASTVNPRKRWLATSDSRTRPTHVAANGQTVGLNEPFLVGGVSMQHPGDPTAPFAEKENCRCTLTWVFD